MSFICLKFSIHVDEGQMEGSVSQIFYLGPSFHFMKSRKKKFKKMSKSYSFFVIR